MTLGERKNRKKLIKNVLILYHEPKEIWQNPKSALITFGQPRVGDEDFADLHDKHINTYKKLRFINEKDAVPKIPLWPWFVHHSRYETTFYQL